MELRSWDNPGRGNQTKAGGPFFFLSFFFFFLPYLPISVFGFNEEELKILSRNLLLLIYYYIKYCVCLHTTGYT